MQGDIVMTVFTVADEQLGELACRQNDLFRQVRDGTLPADKIIRALQALIEGNFDAVPAGLRRLINCDALPSYCPDGLEVVEHKKGGMLEFDSSKIELYIDLRQKAGTITGSALEEALADKRVLNACPLDHLLANTNLIPEEWKKDENGKTIYIYFPGTKYRGSIGILCWRSLYWRAGHWDAGCDYLDGGFGAQDRFAVLASS